MRNDLADLCSVDSTETMTTSCWLGAKYKAYHARLAVASGPLSHVLAKPRAPQQRSDYCSMLAAYILPNLTYLGMHLGWLHWYYISFRVGS